MPAPANSSHKWFHSYRTTALLHVPERNQHLINALPTGHGYVTDKKKKAGLGKQIGIATSEGANAFIAEFEYPGTVDMAGYLAVEESIRYRESLGGEQRIMGYCQDLAKRGAALTAEKLGTEVLQVEEDCAMTQVRLPIDYNTDAQRMAPNARQMDLIHRAMTEHNCCFSPFVHNQTWYARFSAQVFNDLDDFAYVAEALLKLCEGL
jgi:selenocysteine lyase/cysteine desulfurase